MMLIVCEMNYPQIMSPLSPLPLKVGGGVMSPPAPMGAPPMYRAQLSSGTSNALNAVVSSEEIRFKQTPDTVSTDGRVPDKIWERVPDLE